MSELPRDPFVFTNELLKQAITDGVETRRINRDLAAAVRSSTDEVFDLKLAIRELTSEIRAMREEREARPNGHAPGIALLGKP